MSLPSKISPEAYQAVKEELLKELGWCDTLQKAVAVLHNRLGDKDVDKDLLVGRMDGFLRNDLQHAFICYKSQYDAFAAKHFVHWVMLPGHNPPRMSDRELEDFNEHVHWSNAWNYKLHAISETSKEVRVGCVVCDHVVAGASSMSGIEFAVHQGLFEDGPRFQHAFQLEGFGEVFCFSSIHAYICKKCHMPLCCEMLCVLAHHRKCELVPAMDQLEAAVCERDIDAGKEMRWIEQFGENVQ